MPVLQLAQLALSDNAKYAHTSLVLQVGFRRSRTHLALSDNAIYATCIIGIVRQCQICSYQPGITSGFSQNSLHIWHCLTMPFMLIPVWYYTWVFAELAKQLELSNNAIYAGCIFGTVWQCHLCGYLLGITSGFSQNSLHIWHCLTMPFMQLA